MGAIGLCRDDATHVASLLRTIDRGEVELADLFTAGLDAVMHAHTVDSPRTDAAFDRFETGVERYTRWHAGVIGKVRLHLFSDHGMTNTREVSPMLGDFEKLRLLYGRDYIAVWDSTMLRLWFSDKGSPRQEIISWLAGRKEGRIVSDEELTQWGCYFEDGRYGELFSP